MKVLVGMATVLLGAVALGGGAPAGAASTEVVLTSAFNNYGIASSPSSTSNFDGGGYAYSVDGLRLGDPVNGHPGLTAGQTVNAGGFSFTWPNRVNQPDNLEARGQTIPVPALPGATKLGVLAASVQGASGGAFIFNYARTAPDGTIERVSVTKAMAFTDWTRGLLGDTPLEANNTVVSKSLFRHTSSGSVPIPTQPHVFLVTTPLDPSMTLESVKLPISTQIHLFAMALQ